MTPTEQWKAGKLEEYKKYYCKTKWFEDIFQARYYNKDTKGEWWCLENEKYRYNSIFHTKDIEVLAPVPSYEEWQALNKDVDTMTELWKHERSQLSEKIQLIGKLGVQAVDLKSEIQQLRELLRECREFFIGNKTFARDHGCTRAAVEAQQWITKIDNAIGEKK